MVKLSCTCEMEGVRSGLCAPTPICRMPRVSTALPACCHPGNNPVRRAIVISPILHISGEIEAEGEKAACPPWQRQGVNWRLLGRALGMRVCRLSVFQGPLKESTEAPHSSLSLSVPIISWLRLRPLAEQKSRRSRCQLASWPPGERAA